MIALTYFGPNDYRLIEKPIPRIRKGEVLLKVVAAGICGTDIKIFTHGHHAVKKGVTTGHEIVGTIIESKSANTKLQKSLNVLVVTPVGCMKCNYCKNGKQNMCPQVADRGHSIGYYTDGGFAEYLRIPQDAVDQGVLIPIPEKTTVPLTHLPICEPLSCCINGQEKLRICKDDIILIMGAGPIGCMQVSLAKAQKARKIILADIDAKKLDLAKKAGVPADLFINSSKIDLKKRILKETGNIGADVIIIAAPSGKGQEDAIEMAAPMARISFFGGLPKTAPTITLNSNKLHYRELEIYGAYASTRKQYEEALRLVLTKQIDTTKLVTHIFPLEKVAEAIEVMKRGDAIKIILVPGGKTQ